MENKRHLDDSGSGSDGEPDKRIRFSVPEFTMETPFVNGNAFPTLEQLSNDYSLAQGQYYSDWRPEDNLNDGLISELGSTCPFDDASQMDLGWQDYWQDWLQNSLDSGLSHSMLEPMGFQPSATPGHGTDSGFASESALDSYSPYSLRANEDIKATIEPNHSERGKHLWPYAVKQNANNHAKQNLQLPTRLIQRRGMSRSTRV
jgi:hypothetical protein